MKIAIIGGGASGLFAGGFLAQSKNEVTIFDGNEKCGKKIYITGKGRCNVTNNCDVQQYLSNVVNGEKFMMSSINGFPPSETIKFFESNKVKLKTERGGRVFPVSDKASDITKALLSHCKDCLIKLNEKVVSVDKENDKFVIKTVNSTYSFDRVIIATGGKSYPSTGSSGDGYKFAAKFGHKIITPKAALVPIKLKDACCKDLEGLSLKNVLLKCEFGGKRKELFGEMLFISNGISGPIALSLSSFLSGALDAKLSIDLKPALTEKQLEDRLLRDFSLNKNKEIKFIIKGLFPSSLATEFVRRLGVDASLKVNSLTKENREKIIKMLKNFELKYDGLYPIEAGVVTSGGVDLKGVNPKTMESKLVKGLYFIGEVLDVDCLTGGYNLQTAFSTAYACAKNLN